MVNFYNDDCMNFMKDIPDGYYELAIVDPPYFDGPQKKDYYKGKNQKTDIGDYKDLKKSWDIPDKEYFEQLFRVSKNQIIWGCNYFDYVFVGGRIVWIKGKQGSPFSMADIAYHSFYNRIDTFEYLWSGFWQQNMKQKEERIHPTQKPIKLYEWLLINYAKKGDKILDTHGGSGSSAIACHNLGFDLDIIELDQDYFEAMKKRFKEQTKQIDLFRC